LDPGETPSYSASHPDSSCLTTALLSVRDGLRVKVWHQVKDKYAYGNYRHL